MATMTQLQAERESIVAELENPDFDGDNEALITRATAVAQEIAEANERVTRANAVRAQLQAAKPEQIVRPEPSAVQLPEQEERATDFAEKFTRSDAIRNFRAQGFRGNHAADVPLDVRTLVDSSATSGGAFQRPPLVTTLSPQLRQLTVASLLGSGSTTASSIDYVVETTATLGGAAAEVAEGAAKPQAAYTFTQATAPIATIAHWIPITRQAADDNTQLESYIRGRLLYGLQYRLDGQLMNGNGTSPNMRGLLNTTGIQTLTPGAAQARILTIRKAVTLGQLSEFAPDAVVLNPSDWELIEMFQATTNEFAVTPNVQLAMPPRIWGLNVVVTTAIAAGTALVGAFAGAATLWDRMAAQIIVGYVNDDMIKNQMTLLAELRAALTVFRPTAFVKVTFVGTT